MCEGREGCIVAHTFAASLGLSLSVHDFCWVVVVDLSVATFNTLVDDCVDRTPTRRTHLCTCSSSQNEVHKYSHSPREHACFKGQHGSGLRIVVSPKRFRHPSVMSHMLPHLSLNTSTRSLSPASLVFRTSSPSLSCPTSAPSGLDQEAVRDPRGEWAGTLNLHLPQIEHDVVARSEVAVCTGERVPPFLGLQRCPPLPPPSSPSPTLFTRCLWSRKICWQALISQINENLQVVPKHLRKCCEAFNVQLV